MKTFNVSEGLPNYSQRNNQIRPLSTCNTTSYTMATSYIPELWERFQNSEDFRRFSNFPQAEDRLTAALDGWKLNVTVHNDLMNGYNRFMGGRYARFSTANRWTDLVSDMIDRNLPWVGSGTFPGYPNPLKSPLGHIIAVVGLRYESDPTRPEGVIVDDPYGNTMDGWRGSGNDVVIPWELFVKWMKPLENSDGSLFWAHRFVPEGY